MAFFRGAAHCVLISGIIAMCFAPCDTFQVSGLSFLQEAGSLGSPSSQARKASSLPRQARTAWHVCVGRRQGHSMDIQRQHRRQRCTTVLEMSDGATSLSQAGQTSGMVHAVDADDVEEFSQLIVDVFQPEKEGDVVQDWTRKVWWLNVYLGVVSRIFIASYSRGVREGASTSSADIATSPDEFHALFGISDGEGQFCGVVELNCMECPVPKTREGGRASQVPYLSNLAVRADCRGMGFATAMIKRCEEETRSWGADEIFLKTDGDNTNALLLYHKLGYVTEMIDPLTTKKPCVYLRKPLGPAAAPSLPDAMRVGPVAAAASDPNTTPAISFSDDPMYQPRSHPLLQYAGPLAPVIISSWALIAFILF